MDELKHIEELEVQSEMLFNMSVDIKNKAMALRRAFKERGTSSSAPSLEDEEFEKKKNRILHNRKKALTRASIRNKKATQA